MVGTVLVMTLPLPYAVVMEVIVGPAEQEEEQ